MSARKRESNARPQVRSLAAAIARVTQGAGQSQRFRPAVLAVSGAAILGSAIAVLPATTAYAQQSVVEEITVTGTRIRRQDYVANSPITTIDESNFVETATVGVETILNRLPQFVPALTQFTTSDVQQTATNTVGISTVSLRGLGPNRNLVLVNGRRVMPVDPRMVVDTNSIPSGAIARVEVISGGASAVYGADAVGGVVNFVLKDDFEGAQVDFRIGDTQHGGSQETTISALLGGNFSDGRGNMMFGLERSTRAKQEHIQRDWRVADMRNPSTPATAFGWGSDTWISNVNGVFGNLPDQAVVNALFNQAQPCTPTGFGGAGECPVDANGVNLGVPNGSFFGGTTRFLINRSPDGDGTVYTGLMQATGAAGSYRYTGPLNSEPDGQFQGLPYRVFQPNGNIKENNFWQWASLPMERYSTFARGHLDIADSLRVTGQAMFTRTNTRTSLGLSSDLITLWGAEVPFSNNIYMGDPSRGIPATLLDPNDPTSATHPAYLPGGAFGVNCPATGGCTDREVWPLPPEIIQIFDSRPDNEASVWINRPPDYIRSQLGPRMGNNTTTVFQVSLGLEGEFSGGNHYWDVTVNTGRTDNLVVQTGGSRLSSYREIMSWPNFGTNYEGDPNPFGVGFAEGTPTCTSGIPVVADFPISRDCVAMMSPNLQNRNALSQSVLEANLAGNLAQMSAGPLQYAVGAAYRENDYSFVPDNLSLNQNVTDPIAGLFPNEPSAGEFDVTELYGELLIPVISNGPTGVHHFNVEVGARISDWSMPQVNNLGSYKALIDWAITPRYRLRGGWNRAHRAPNLAELFVTRTQIFGATGASFGDQCSQNNQTGPFSANPDIAGAAQAAQTLAICRALMGETGAAEYYDNRPLADQPELGGIGIPNSFGNRDLREEQANTLTMGMVMNVAQNWTLTVDWYEIEIKDMIALESGDSIYQRCLSLDLNPTGDPNSPGCQLISRHPLDGAGVNIDRTFTNLGRAKVAGVDLSVNWARALARGGINVNVVANYNLKSETQDAADFPTIDWSGTQGCALQIQCQGYDYRVFSTVGYFQGPWSITLRHQYWPTIDAAACIANPTGTGCRFGGVQTDYHLFALAGSFRFSDRYTLRYGIENLLDTKPPRTGGNPEASPFPIPATRTGGGLGAGAGGTYDPLGRRGFVSLRMDF